MDAFREQPLRRAWLRGYRKGDVQFNLAGLRLHLQGAAQELEAARRRIDELTAEVRELRERDDAVRAKDAALVEALAAVREEHERLEGEAQARADEVLRAAEARAAEIGADAQRRAEELQSRNDELVALRARLVEGLRTALDDVDAVVRSVEADLPAEQPAGSG